MSEETIRLHIRRIDDRVQFETSGNDQPPLHVDSHPPIGNGNGYTPLELLLIAYESCTSMALISLLTDRMRRRVTAMEAQAVGYLKDEHPKSFSRIELALTITSPDATEAEIDRALDSAEKKICPVWDMIRGNVDVALTYTLKR